MNAFTIVCVDVLYAISIWGTEMCMFSIIIYKQHTVCVCVPVW